MADDNDDTGSGDQTGDDDDTHSGDETQDDGLGDAGKRALEAERTSRRAAEKRTREIEAELARVRESSMSEQEKAIAQARREAQAEAAKGFNVRLVQAEVRAAAAGKLTDPEDAIRFLNLDEFPVGDDGDVDKKAVTAAVVRLVKDKPYLAAGATRATGDADQGARGGAGSELSMNELIRGGFRR